MNTFLMKYLSIFLFVIPLLVFGQNKTEHKTIRWVGIEQISIGNETLRLLNFDGAVNDDAFGLLPVFVEMTELPVPGMDFRYRVDNAVFVPFDHQDEIKLIADIDLVSRTLEMRSEKAVISGKTYDVFKLLPLRIDPETGLIEKLTAFDLVRIPLIGEPEILKSGNNFAENSVLAEGDWYKISVQKSGIYKVTYSMLKEMGVDADNINPQNIRLYGNGGGMLPELNSTTVPDDLIENAIWVEDGGDNSFDEGDYFLFYGESPVKWVYEPINLAFSHIENLYSDYTYYFITVGDTPGKRIQTVEQSPHPATQVFTDFHDYDCHEINTTNLIHSGKDWYGEEFNETLNYTFPFDFPNIDTSYSNYFVGRVAAKSNAISHFSIYINDDSLTSVTVPAIPPQSIIIFANATKRSKRFKVSNDHIDVKISYDKPNESAKGWLNNFEINVRRKLKYLNTQLPFRNIFSIGAGNISEFKIASVPGDLMVWDVTNCLAPANLDHLQAGDTLSFRIATDSLKEFIAFGMEDMYVPGIVGKIENQNLHALKGHDFIIVAHPDFMEQAQRLKAFHESVDGMQICLVTPQQIYNEFSSGAQDPSAIRNFVKMIYQRSGEPSTLKYLLLFGDGSYDPKDRLEGNRNFIVAYQSKQSLKLTSSYVTDDFFGLMDPNEGYDASGNVDIGVGRLPVTTPDEAEEMVDKIENYMTYSAQTQGPWRNKMCFVADDEDYNLHFYQADTVLAKDVARKNPSMNINKIYLDAFQQISTSGGQRYPEANAALNRQVQEGAIFMNYTGHGGELGWSAENVLQISDINSWTNFDKLPVFITATCEFSRFDNPSMTSAGELVLINPVGGGIALLTTTRLSFAQSNLTLNRRIYDTLFSGIRGSYPRLGDLIKFSKNPSSTNIRNFVLLGDPALKLAFPKYDVVTDTINGIPVGEFTDTLRANGQVTVKGYIADFNNDSDIVSQFNGVLYPVLYDKATILTTLGNDPESSPAEFTLQDRILYKGKVSVVNGRFSFSFIIPKDISYQYGNGKLSYYAADSLYDAGGYYDEFILGGYCDSPVSDTEGPEIKMYFNDSLFINGSMIGNEPVLYAELFDRSGINNCNSGVGHDIVATLDDQTSNRIVLNDYFEPGLDDFTSGMIVYPFGMLSKGKHTLELKAWDMYNNSSSASIEFYISDSISITLTEVMNFPNPFTDETRFTFRHNQFGEDLSVEIRIFDFNGQLVTTIKPDVVTNGYTIDPIFWDGTGSGGSKLNPGYYFYKIKVSNGIGYQTERTQKLIIMK